MSALSNKSLMQPLGIVIKSLRVVQNTQGWASQALEEDGSSFNAGSRKVSNFNCDIECCLVNPAKFKTLEEQDRVSFGGGWGLDGDRGEADFVVHA